MRRLLLLVVIITIFSVMIITCSEIQNSYTPTQENLRAIGHIINFEKTMRFGYGFLVASDQESGYVITCRHVANFGVDSTNCQDTLIFESVWDKIVDTIIFLGESRAHDIAVYKTISPNKERKLTLGDYNSSKIGDTLTTMIWTNFKEAKYAKGPITGYYVDIIRDTIFEWLVVAKIGGPGTSGSPVFNSDGEVIAIVSMGGINSMCDTCTELELLAVPLKIAPQLVEDGVTLRIPSN